MNLQLLMFEEAVQDKELELLSEYNGIAAEVNQISLSVIQLILTEYVITGLK